MSASVDFESFRFPSLSGTWRASPSCRELQKPLLSGVAWLWWRLCILALVTSLVGYVTQHCQAFELRQVTPANLFVHPSMKPVYAHDHVQKSQTRSIQQSCSPNRSLSFSPLSLPIFIFFPFRFLHFFLKARPPLKTMDTVMNEFNSYLKKLVWSTQIGRIVPI